MKVILVLLLHISVAVAVEERWINSYDQPLHYYCPSHQSIRMVSSIHDNHREDRVWDFSCQNTFSVAASCSWSGYVNDFDQEFNFICPFGSVISGVESYHDNKREDRRWKFLCCQGNEKVDKNCEWSNYANDFDAYLKWEAKPNEYLTGAQSYHDNKREDRRWRFHSCQKRM